MYKKVAKKWKYENIYILNLLKFYKYIKKKIEEVILKFVYNIFKIVNHRGLGRSAPPGDGEMISRPYGKLFKRTV